MTDQQPFPFTALLGQSDLQQALLLAAVDPRLGGVLISGPRGTAKTTSARALAELLPEGEFVSLPLAASEEQLIGSLDLHQVLADGCVAFKPGLLARAHRGVLYVDEVNLLPDQLIDPLLDVAASGINIIERDGISQQHAAEFVLIGSMNPEEGELRPQLLDRFGLCVSISNYHEPLLRQQILAQRLAFDQNPAAFRQSHAEQQTQLREQLLNARQQLPQLHYDDSHLRQVSELCLAAGVDGLRADLSLLRAARALAALQHSERLQSTHIEQVAEWVLQHRRKTRAGQQPEPAASRSQQQQTQTNTPTTDWGELPPQPVPIQAAQRLAPMPLKKP